MKILKNISVLRLVITANILTLIIMNYINIDFTLGNWYNSIIMVIGIYIGNIILWPILTKVLMKFIILSYLITDTRS